MRHHEDFERRGALAESQADGLEGAATSQLDGAEPEILKKPATIGLLCHR